MLFRRIAEILYVIVDQLVLFGQSSSATLLKDLKLMLEKCLLAAKPIYFLQRMLIMYLNAFYI